jgi:Fe-Mn family superoxide dismutase
MDARIPDLPYDPTALTGPSEQLRSHQQNHWAGAVGRPSAIRAQLGSPGLASATGVRPNGLEREELVANHSMMLRELYFASLGAGAQPMAPAMALALAASFGSVDRWREEFVAMGQALAGDSGWVLLSFQPREGTLVNQCAADHAHALAGGIPILALDMVEHAYDPDFGAAAGPHVDAFVANIDWTRVYERYQAAVERSSEALAASPDEVAGATLLDVRRAGVFEQADALIEGARWRDPKDVGTWAAELAAGEDVIVYCVYGHEVGRSTAMRLRAAGVKARFLRGGFDGWKAAGRPLRTKGGQP